MIGKGKRHTAIQYAVWVLSVSVVTLSIRVSVDRGWVGSIIGMQRVCGVACFPHDIFFPGMKGLFGFGNEPSIWGIPVWNIAGGFIIMAIYYSLLFLPLLFWSQAKERRVKRRWALCQCVLVVCHLALYVFVTMPMI